MGRAAATRARRGRTETGASRRCRQSACARRPTAAATRCAPHRRLCLALLSPPTFVSNIGRQQRHMLRTCLCRRWRRTRSCARRRVGRRATRKRWRCAADTHVLDGRCDCSRRLRKRALEPARHLLRRSARRSLGRRSALHCRRSRHHPRSARCSARCSGLARRQCAGWARHSGTRRWRSGRTRHCLARRRRTRRSLHLVGRWSRAARSL